jgi:integrase
VSRLPDVTEEEWLVCDNFNRKIVEEFLKQAHLSPQTLKQYRSALRIFCKWVHDECDNKPIHKLKTRHAMAYQNYLIEFGLSNKAVKFKRAAVSSVCGYIETFYDDDYPEFRNIYNKKVPSPGTAPKREKLPLSEEEFNSLIDTLEKRGNFDMVAYLRFSYSSGCRRAEARQLLKEVVNYEKVKDKPYYATHKLRAKGRGREGKVRSLFFEDDAMDAIRKWLEVRGEDDCPYVFATKENGEYKQIGPNTFNYWCSKIFTKIVGRRVHPHLLRSTRATHLVVSGGKNIEAAQALLGHESAETTRLYVIKQGSEDLDSVFD